MSAPEPTPGAPDARALDAAGLRLAFVRQGDRWSHRLEVADGSGSRVVAAALEGDPDRDDPARVVSPAYQEFREHTAGRPGPLLLTGQSTPHHFSAAVTARDGADGGRFEFDVADRCRGAVDVLAATYLVEATSGDLVAADDGRIAWESPSWGHGRLELVAEPPARLALAEAGRRATRVQVLAAPPDRGFTFRFVYSWRWSAPPP